MHGMCKQRQAVFGTAPQLVMFKEAGSVRLVGQTIGEQRVPGQIQLANSVDASIPKRQTSGIANYRIGPRQVTTCPQDGTESAIRIRPATAITQRTA